jgi:hypothetical protein
MIEAVQEFATRQLIVFKVKGEMEHGHACMNVSRQMNDPSGMHCRDMLHHHS